MAYSKELGYDPDEWEECENDEGFMIFGLYTRLFLTLFTLLIAALIFWLIEARKQWAKAEKEPELLKTSAVMCTFPMVEYSVVFGFSVSLNITFEAQTSITFFLQPSVDNGT